MAVGNARGEGRAIAKSGTCVPKSRPAAAWLGMEAFSLALAWVALKRTPAALGAAAYAVFGAGRRG